MFRMWTLLVTLSVFCYISSATDVDGILDEALDYDTILSQDDLLKPYLDCLLEHGYCNEEGSYLKKAVTYLLQSECRYCSQEQVQRILTLIGKLKQYRPEILQDILNKYDPDNNHWEAFEKLIKHEE